MRLIIEGNISSGKSTLIRYFQKKIKDDEICINDSGRIYFNTDPRFNVLQLASNDPKRWTFLLQLTFLSFLKEREKEDAKRFTITARSTLSVINVFSKSYLEQGFISNEEYNYLESFDNLHKSEPCDILIFISSTQHLNRCSNSLMKEKSILYSQFYERKRFLDTVISKRFAKKIIILNGDLPLEELERETDATLEIPGTDNDGIMVYEANTYQEVLKLINTV